MGGRESLIFSLVTSSSFFFKSESGERKEQITIFLTASIYWLIGSQNVAPKGETTDSSKSKTDNTTLYTQWNKPSPFLQNEKKNIYMLKAMHVKKNLRILLSLSKGRSKL